MKIKLGLLRAKNIIEPRIWEEYSRKLDKTLKKINENMTYKPTKNNLIKNVKLEIYNNGQSGLVEFVPKKGNGIVTEEDITYLLIPKKHLDGFILDELEEMIKQLRER